MKIQKTGAAVLATILLLLLFSPAVPARSSLFGEGGPLSGSSGVLVKDGSRPGDVNGDNEITAEDARLALRCAVGLETYEKDSAAYKACDMDGDGSVTAADARVILRAAVGLPAEETEEPETTTEEPTTPVPPTPPEPTTAIPLPTQPPTTAAPTTAPNVPRTSKGYEIKTVNGVTYVGGVLIANKTYSLPRSYAPGKLTAETQAAFNRMQSAAKKLGLSLWISSGYRSYDLQASLYNRYKARDGKAAADRYSARPGHSEHQTGLCFDLNTITQSFANTAEGRWVAKNCWRYGFIIRYPQGKESKTGYMYEPWHLRYLGETLAKKVYDSGLCLEEYLGITSYYH